MYKCHSSLCYLVAIIVIILIQNSNGTPIRFDLKSMIDGPQMAGQIYIDFIDGNGMTGSNALLYDISINPTNIVGSISEIADNNYYLTDDDILSTFTIETDNIYDDFAFTLNANWVDDLIYGFPDALALTLTGIDGFPLFHTEDPRGTDIFFVVSAAGIENYTPVPFSLTITDLSSASVPEPSTFWMLTVGFVLFCFICGKRKKFVSSVFAFSFIIISPLKAAMNDVSDKVTIDRSPLIFNRVSKTFDGMVTIKNVSTETLNSPIYLVVSDVPTSVSVNNAINLTIDGKPMLKLPIADAGLNPGEDITNYIIKFHNPDKIKFTASFKILSYIGTLPNDPGETGKSTIEGIDSNNNGIRDDVEIYIAVNFGYSEKLLEALNQLAISTQKGITATNMQESMDAANADVRSMECFRYVMGRSDFWKSVVAQCMNTEDRIRAWNEHEKRIGGKVFPGSKNKKASCTFNPDELSN